MPTEGTGRHYKQAWMQKHILNGIYKQIWATIESSALAHDVLGYDSRIGSAPVT